MLLHPAKVCDCTCKIFEVLIAHAKPMGHVKNYTHQSTLLLLENTRVVIKKIIKISRNCELLCRVLFNITLLLEGIPLSFPVIFACFKNLKVVELDIYCDKMIQYLSYDFQGLF